MNQALYPKEVKCPICNNKFNALKLKSNACIVTTKDEDFCTYYKDMNPMFYEIFVCPVCGYAASENTFDNLKPADVQMLREAFSGRYVKRNFCEERTLNDALDSFKLALYTANLRNAKNSLIAGLCLKIAWMYRMLEDEREIQFLSYSLENYKEAFSKESLPIGNLNKISMLYLLGELSRRVGNIEESIQWFSKAVVDPERHANPRIERLARDQWTLAKEQFKSKQDE